MTEEICAENGLTVDKKGFDADMEKQKNAGKDDAAKKDFAWEDKEMDYLLEGKTEFTGYDKVIDACKIDAMYIDTKSIDVAEDGMEVNVVLDKTPFYAESGGQLSDEGVIYNDDGVALVTDVQKYRDVFIHKVKISKGCLKTGDEITAMVSERVRNRISRNHTATHLLQKALRQVLGDHVQQSGSMVNREMLRFDFSHYEQVTAEQISEVEKIVNDNIDMFLPVETKQMPIKEAIKTGAMSLFEEKYGDIVRVVSVGDFSKELCGGTHVKNSGQIGSFKIISESGIASGVRRIEAVTGTAVLERLINKEKIVSDISEKLKTTPDQLASKVDSITSENRKLSKKLESYIEKSLGTVTDKLIEDSKEINGIRLVTRLFKDYKINDLRGISDNVKAKYNNVAMVLATQSGEKITFLVSLSDDVVKSGHHAGKMIKEIAAAAGGSGGGKANMAQAGANDPSKIKEAFEVAEKLL